MHIATDILKAPTVVQSIVRNKVSSAAISLVIQNVITIAFEMQLIKNICVRLCIATTYLQVSKTTGNVLFAQFSP